MSSGGGGGTNTTVQQSGPPPQVLANYQQVYDQARNVAAQPHQAYDGATVAGFTPLQMAGFNDLQTAGNASKPYLDSAAQYMTNAGTSVDPSHFAQTVQAYQSPYTQQVVDATKAQFANQDAQQQQQIAGNAISSGAWGGDRAGVAQGIAAGQEALAHAPVIAGLYNTGYQNATSAAQSNAYLNSQTGFGMANLGNEAQQQGMQTANAELGAGGMQQQEAQNELNVPYQSYLAAQGYPYQITNWLEGLATGTGALSGTQGSQTTPGPSPLSQVAGLGTAAVGGLGASGAFGNNGWLTGGWGGGGDIAGGAVGSGYYHSGGRIPGFAPGGAVETPSMDINVIPAESGVGGGLLGGGGNLLNTNTATTATTTDNSPKDSIFGTILKTAGTIAAAYYGGPAGGQAASALSSQVHFARGGGIEGYAKTAGLRPVPVRPRGFDTGGTVNPGLTASVGGSPGLVQAAQTYDGLPTDQLHQMAARYPPTTPQGQLVARALQKRQLFPQSNPVQPTVQQPAAQGGMGAMQPGMARGGDVEDEDTLPDLIVPQVGPSVPGGMTAGLGPMESPGPMGPMGPRPASVPTSLLGAVSAAVHQNESGGRMTPGIVGDNGKSGGPMQVQQGVLDQVNHKLGTRYSFEDMVRDPMVGKMVGETHLASLLEKYSNPAYAMGAYNAGEDAMDHALHKGSGISGLPHSTQEYIARGLRSLGQGVARGGAIHLADGGEADDDLPLPPDAPSGMLDDTGSVTPGWRASHPQSGGITDGGGGSLPGPTAGFKASPWESLLAAGLGMMAGTSPHAAVNIGAGGLAGVKDYQQQRQLGIQDRIRADTAKTNAVWRAGQLANTQARNQTYDRRVTDLGDQGDRRLDQGDAMTAARQDYLQWKQTHGDATADQQQQKIDELKRQHGVTEDQGNRRLDQGDRRLDQGDRGLDLRTQALQSARDDRERALIEHASEADLTRATSLVSSSRDVMGKPTKTLAQALSDVAKNRPVAAPQIRSPVPAPQAAPRTPAQQSPPVGLPPGAKLAPDGKYYVPNPSGGWMLATPPGG